ncbi:MAG TPA: FGGY-family carbohydrate kinase [Acidimicrobiia bacterium]
MSSEVTVGIDIGTSSVKAIAADGDGNVVARARVPHQVVVPGPEQFEHDAAAAWRDGPRRALAELGDLDVRGVSVAAMVPSLTAVDEQGTPLTPGLLYGDERGRTGVVSQAGTDDASADEASGGFLGYVRWLHDAVPSAHGFWPAQSVANHALAGEAVLDTTTASLAHPLFDFTGWDPAVAAELGITPAELPRLVPTGWECGRIDGDGPALASGCIDAMAEQLVAGADQAGDVLVLLGTTLIVWVVAHEGAEVPGYVTIPHTASGNYLVGGPSNAGGMFRDWATRFLAPPADRALDPGAIPVWAPYPRGERVPLNDHTRRASLHRLDLTHDAAAIVRAADEASAFVVKRAVDAAVAHAGVQPKRVVASGGGTRVDAWVQAIADVTGLPVDCVAVPEGGALGSAWLARIAAGLEEPMAMTEGRRWAQVGRRVEPRGAWTAASSDRYEEFLALS